MPGGKGVRLHVGDRGQLGDGDVPGGRAAHEGPAVRQLDVVGRRLEAVGGDGAELLPQHRRGGLDRARHHGPRPAPAGARAVGGQRRVALDGVHVLDRHAEGVGGELHHGGLQAVAAGAPGDRHVDVARGVDPDRGPLRGVVPVAGGGGLDVAARAHPDVAARGERLGLLRPERPVVQGPDRLLEGLPRRHVGVRHPAAVVHGQLRGADHVSAAELEGIHAQLPGGPVEGELAGQRLEHPRPPVRRAPHGVGEHRTVPEPGDPHPVGPGEDHAHRRSPCPPARESGRRRRPARGRSGRRGSCRRRRRRPARRGSRGGPVRRPSGSRGGSRTT